MIIANLKEVIGVSVGNTEIKEVWAGDSKVFPDGPIDPGYFYVYHSSTGIIERFPVQRHFNLVNKVTTGHIYTGYSLSIGNGNKSAGDYTKAIMAGTFEEDYPDVHFVDDKLQDINCLTYDGSEIATKIDGVITRLLPAKAEMISNECGADFTPVKNTVYFVLETLDSFYRLRLVKITNSVDSNDILNAYGYLCGVDHNLLEQPKIFVDNTEYGGTLLVAVTFQYTKDGVDGFQKVQAKNLNLPRGYMITNMSAVCKTKTTDPFALNSEYLIRFEFTTLDGYNWSTRTAKLETNDGTKDNIISTYID